MGRRKLSHRIGPFLARALGPPVVRALGASWRVRFDPPDFKARILAGGARVYAFWHGNLLVPSAAIRGTGAAVMISRHADGEVIARIVQRLGYTTVRGSSTRGGAGALLRRGWETRSWDRFRIPRPFTTVAIVEGERLRPPPGIEGASLEEWRVRLEAALEAADARAQGMAEGRAP